MNPRLFFSAAAAAVALAGAVSAQEASRHVTVGDLIIVEPWSRATPGGAKIGAGYLVVENRSSAPDRLIGGSFERAGRVELHEMSMVDNIMRMRPLEQGLVIPAGGQVELKPGGFHAMFVDLKAPLKEGERVKGTLTFERAGTASVEYVVGSIAAQGPAVHHQHH
jgi:copper(I)-binding protein